MYLLFEPHSISLPVPCPLDPMLGALFLPFFLTPLCFIRRPMLRRTVARASILPRALGLRAPAVSAPMRTMFKQSAVRFDDAKVRQQKRLLRPACIPAC